MCRVHTCAEVKWWQAEWQTVHVARGRGRVAEAEHRDPLSGSVAVNLLLHRRTRTKRRCCGASLCSILCVSVVPFFQKTHGISSICGGTPQTQRGISTRNTAKRTRTAGAASVRKSCAVPWPLELLINQNRVGLVGRVGRLFLEHRWFCQR